MPLKFDKIVPFSECDSRAPYGLKQDQLATRISEYHPNMIYANLNRIRSLTVIASLKELIEFSAEVVPLEQQKVPAVSLVGQTIQRDTLGLPKTRDLRHSVGKVWELLAHAHLDVSLDLFDPPIESVF